METTGRVPVWTLGDRLMKARRDAGLSQEEMAEALLVSRNTVIGWERDQHRPPRRKLAAWALRTGVDQVWITSDDADIADAGGRTTGWLGGHRALPVSLIRRWLPRRMRRTREASYQARHYAAAIEATEAPAFIPDPRDHQENLRRQPRNSAGVVYIGRRHSA